MMELTWDLARLTYSALSLYSLFVLFTRWRVVKVMTEERRWLFLFITAEATAAGISGVLKTALNSPGDSTVFLTVITQALLSAYLHNFVPKERRRWWTRSSPTRATPRSSWSMWRRWLGSC